MSILGYAYIPDVAGTNTQLGHLTTPKFLNDPPGSIMMLYDQGGVSIVDNWYRRKAYDNANANPKGAGWYDGSPLVLFAEVPPGSTELWIRFMDYDTSPGNNWTNQWTWYNDGLFAEFFNITNGVKKLVAKLWSNNGTSNSNSSFFYTLYGDDGTTAVKTHRIGYGSQFRSNPANGEMVVDLRLSFDKVAGFIQQYDYSATRVNEVLGQTLNNLPITHVAVYSDYIAPKDDSYGTAVFRLVANEPTFGMYVMPFYAKAEGTDQNHIQGDYNRFAMGRRSFTPTTGVALEKPENGDPVRYSYTPKTLTEQGLPANYNVLSVQVNAVVDGSAATADPIDFCTYLKQKSTGTRFEIANQTVRNNVDYSITKSPQVRNVRWDKNPATGQNWQPGDFSDFEIGFKI